MGSVKKKLARKLGEYTPQIGWETALWMTEAYRNCDSPRAFFELFNALTGQHFDEVMAECVQAIEEAKKPAKQPPVAE